uniref:NADH-ubiquinone oxidoreductase chain 5 n=1 Tax=Philotrypesis sp. JHX-2011 TaxID=1035792 RepID=G8EEI9_9HYME|nr:NADH dehydrogenase subunit 5 [Philotrypesis sp. JHX-2011]
MLLYYLSGMFMLMFSVFFMIFSLISLLIKKKMFLEWNILILNSLGIHMFMYIDWVSMMFIGVVMLISSMIMIYCSEYMNHDNYKIRFYYLILLFIISMVLMVISPNLISLMIGWDGLGLISYCLIIYYQNYSSFNSGMLTVLMNRIGDVMILLSISMMVHLGSWNFINLNYYNKLCIFMIIIAAFTKSAQFPFSSWLPAAMAAPTPVSSLVHSSTLVTAGVYLMIRFHYLIFKNYNMLFYIVLIGLLTMMFAGFSANFEYDMKKIIAYSTLSQLGLMMMIFGMKNWELSYFHLIIHAMFKSMMFMSSGILIHSMQNYQDIRYMSKMKLLLPLTFSMFIIGNLSLCGMPFMSGFYSKDQVLEFMFMEMSNNFIYLLLLLSTGLTVSYSIRILFYLMNDYNKFLPYCNIKDFKFMNYPMIILTVLSIIFGSLMNWILFNNIENIFMLKIEKMTILLICLMFIFVGKMNYLLMKYKYIYMFKYFLGKMWFLYNFTPFFTYAAMKLSEKYYSLFDKGWSEYFLKNIIMILAMKLNKSDNLNLTNNLMFLMVCMVWLVIILIM